MEMVAHHRIAADLHAEEPGQLAQPIQNPLLYVLNAASLSSWWSGREERYFHVEALTSSQRLLPPSWAQVFGTSCGLDRSSQGSLGPRSAGETHVRYPSPARPRVRSTLTSAGDRPWPTPLVGIASASELIPRATVIASGSSGPIADRPPRH